MLWVEEKLKPSELFGFHLYLKPPSVAWMPIVFRVFQFGGYLVRGCASLTPAGSLICLIKSTSPAFDLRNNNLTPRGHF